MRVPSTDELSSIVRTLTAALLALSMVGGVIYMALVSKQSGELSGLQAVLVGWAGVVVGFYFGGHIAASTTAQDGSLFTSLATQSAEAAVHAAKVAVERPPGSRRVTDPLPGEFHPENLLPDQETVPGQATQPAAK
jgi:hypothetical protein